MLRETTTKDLAGYYAHIAASGQEYGRPCSTPLIKPEYAMIPLWSFTSDHGDMLGSHGEIRKQKPWDEAIRVAFPAALSATLYLMGGRELTFPMTSPDIMPTLLGLCSINGS